MRLEELVPEKMIWSLGSVAMLMAGALFAYEMLRPELKAHASGPSSLYPTVEAAHVTGLGKQSPFIEDTVGQVLVKLPELPAKYQRKVFYLWRPSSRVAAQVHSKRR
jgi:hypothetical protein